MKISVIIPMFNEAQHIGRTLDSVMAAASQAGLAHELLVVDNGSTDAGPQIARLRGARVLEGAGLNIGALRNHGAAQAQGQWLAFLDADMEVPPAWFVLWSCVRIEDRADMLALACDTPTVAPWFARAWQKRSRSGTALEQHRDWLPTANLCLSREWFERIGGFDETLRTGEDKDFGLRLHKAGARMISLSEPSALHWGYETSWTEWLGKELWRQGSHLQLLKERLDWRHLRFPAVCAGVLLMSLLALGAALSGAPAVAGILLLPGLVAALGLSLRQSWHHREPFFSIQLAVLHWIRLHLTAVGLLGALANYSLRRPARG